MKKAAFSLEDIIFNRISIESSFAPINEISIDFIANGQFNLGQNEYDLKLIFHAFDEENQSAKRFIEIELVATFEFSNVNSIMEIPEYFYRNAIAIVYPYIRAFVTNIVFQANLKRKIVLPIMNLADLGDSLRENTISV